MIQTWRQIFNKIIQSFPNKRESRGQILQSLPKDGGQASWRMTASGDLLSTSAATQLFKNSLSRITTIEESFIFKGRWPRQESSAWSGLSWALLMVLVISAVFVPRISLGGFSRYYSFDLKIEDLMLAGLMLVFFVFRPIDLFSSWRHAAESSFLCFLIAAAFSIPVGMMAGTLDKPLMSLLYLIKWFEYFLVFFFSVRLSQAVGSERMVHLFFWLGLALAAYGYYEHFAPVSKAAYPNYYRLYERPPFHGDANHIGGLLAMWLSFFSYVYLRLPLTPTLSPKRGEGELKQSPTSSWTGLGDGELKQFPSPLGRGLGEGELKQSPTSSWTGLGDGELKQFPSPFGRGLGEGRNGKWILLVALFFVFFPFIWTFSRKSYLAFAGAYFILFFLVRGARRRWVLLACMLICAGLLLPTRLAERVSDLGAVMSTTDPYHSSWAGNMDVWKRSFWNFERFWLFGAGLGARHRLFYESQYVMTLTETGLFGFSAFMTVLLVPAFCTLRRVKMAGSQGLLAGAWLSAWVAFMIHNLSCVSLTVSKCAVVWWFLTGAFLGAVQKRKDA